MAFKFVSNLGVLCSKEMRLVPHLALAAWFEAVRAGTACLFLRRGTLGGGFYEKPDFWPNLLKNRHLSFPREFYRTK